MQNSGPISLSDIQNIFGGDIPISLSEYYNDNQSGYASGISGIPNIGNEISISAFYGKTKTKKVVFCACSEKNTYVILSDHQIYSWGNYNYFGQLGVGDTDTRNTPIPVSITGIVFNFVSCSTTHAIALDDSGNAYAWGYNVGGELGVGDYLNRNAPTSVVQDEAFISVACGKNTSCAITSEGVLYLWGNNISSKTPKTNDSITARFKYIESCNTLSAGITYDGFAYTWGSANTYGQLGNDVSGSIYPTAVNQDSNIRYTEVHCGLYFCIALTTHGIAHGWGYNQFYQLGTGDNVNSPYPKEVLQGDLIFKTIKCGNGHTLALTGDGLVYAWGGNWYYQLGDNSKTNRSSPVPVQQGDLIFKSIFTGYFNDVSYALTDDDKFYGWGDNQYNQQLKDGSSINVPTEINLVI